jgi:hypothetical protein
MRLTRRQLHDVIATLAGTVQRGMDAPPEVLDYFRAKDLTPRFSWLDVWGQEHAHAFTVAGVTETRVLSEFKAAIDKAVAEGRGFEAFRADMRERLAPLGWWGPRQVADPDGRWATKAVDFSKPRRLEITFWSNMRAARAAGQWNRIQRTKRVLPYLLYVRSTAERKRPEHLAWAGIILPVDHSFWRTHFPPNGWMCQCAVRQIDQEDRDARLAREPGDGGIAYRDTPPPEETRRYVNRRTGEVTEVPVGIDPGWHTNPGLSRARTLVSQLTQTLDEAGPERAARTIAKLWSRETPGGGSWPKAIAKMPERVHLPVASSARAAAEMEAKGEVIAVASDVLAAKVSKHARVDIQSFGLIQQILDEGEWLDRGDPTIRHVLAVIDGVYWVLALRRSQAGYIQVRTLFAADEIRHRDIRARERRFREMRRMEEDR